MENFDPALLSIALGLSWCAFFIGMMLRTTPYRRYRAAGTEMMEDGFIALALISTISIIVGAWGVLVFILYGGQSMDVVYQGYYDYIVATKNGAFTIISIIAGITWFIGMGNVAVGIIAPGSQPLLPLSLTFQSQMGPWISMLQTTYSLMVTLESLGHILQEKLLVFVSFGCVLYAVPRRLTRAAGGALIAWPLVFYFGLPLLPTFVSTYGGPTYHTIIDCSPASCPAFETLGVGSGNWWNVVSGLVNFGVVISEGAASLIWLNFMLPVLWLAILSLAAAGVGRLFGGYVNVLQQLI